MTPSPLSPLSSIPGARSPLSESSEGILEGMSMNEIPSDYNNSLLLPSPSLSPLFFPPPPSPPPPPPFESLPFQISEEEDLEELDLDSSLLTKKELWGWYGYGWASESYR